MVKPLRAGLLLSRTPVITPEPGAFLKSYYNYMTELERRLMWTFPSYFYFKRGTLAQRRYNDLQKGPMARHKGVYYPDGLPDVHHNRDRRFKQEINIVPDEQEKVKLQSRQSEDKPTSLARKLDSTLYLLVKNGSTWKLPSFDVQDDAKSLHEVTETGIHELGGENMNLWTVSNTPAAVLKSAGDKPEFIIKSHILHGQFQPQSKPVEFAWLAKNEIKDKVDAKYFAEIEPLL